MSAIKSKPAKRNQAAVVTPTSSLPEKIDRYWLNAAQSGETSMSFEPALGMRMFGRLSKLDGFDPSRSVVSQFMDAMVFDKS